MMKEFINRKPLYEIFLENQYEHMCNTECKV